MRSHTVLLVLVVVSSPHCCACDGSVVVSVTGGTIVGTTEGSALGRAYSAFRAVPYAGFVEGAAHRFKYSYPVEPWEGDLPCVEEGPYCAQAGYGEMKGEEDCLHLSVYTPQIPDGSESSLLPVLVWLPGGAFLVSGAGAYDPRLLMDRNVVLVVPQYRLGILGFFNGLSEAPGNYGMMDQVGALQWVQDNIAQFGGDPKKVTLGGDCAGGASAIYHMISNKSKDLFHRVISISGSPLNPWALQPRHRRTMLIIESQLKCPSHNLTQTVECLSGETKESLLEVQMHLLEAKDLFVGNGGFAPVVQDYDKLNKSDLFLPEHPIVTLTEGRFAQVPTLLMTSKDVGSYVVDMALYDWMLHMQEERGAHYKDEVITLMVPQMGIHVGSAEEEQVWAQYLPGLRGASVEHKLPGIAEMLTDTLYNAGIIETARYLNDKVPTYLLRFDFDAGPHSFYQRHPDPALAPPMQPGAGHGDELNYFLPEKYDNFDTQEQRTVSKMMLDIIDNFVNGGAPGSDWPETTDEGLECAVVTKGATLEQGVFLATDRVKTGEMLFRMAHRRQLDEMGQLEKGQDEKRKKYEL